MNIKILDSWLREHLKTNAAPKDIAFAMSLTSVSIERMEKFGTDIVYDIEITTNRPDLMSVIGLAREAAAVLPQFGYEAQYIPLTVKPPEMTTSEVLPLTVISDDRYINRLCAIVMEVQLKPSPQVIQDRLETSDIRSLNNLIDITNYVMRITGHPTHVFDYDRIHGHLIKIRESKKGEEIVTLDGKKHSLPGGDIVAEDADGNIIDLLGIMGLENSVVTSDTKRIVFFVNNNDPHKIRKTSMMLGIRTDAAQINEKSIDPELAMTALLTGIELYQKHANGQIRSTIVDMYPQPYKEKTVTVSEKELKRVMAIPITLDEAANILKKLGCNTSLQDGQLQATIPSFRADDITIPEDLIEEVARVYGYHNLPDTLPAVTSAEYFHLEDSPYYWEDRVKQAMKFWGYTEVYTYPMVSEEMYEGPVDDAVTLANPLGEEFVYMRRTLVPSLLKVMKDNKQYESMKVFEISNVYEKQENNLPKEIRILAGLVKKPHASFFEVKGVLESLAGDLGITGITFHPLSSPGLETEVKIDKTVIGTVEVLDDDVINFEINFELFIQHATLRKTYIPTTKYPPVIEDIAFVIDESIPTGDIIAEIKSVEPRITAVSLLDRFQNSRTFHVLYQDKNRNLSTDDVSTIREKIIARLAKTFHAKQK